jgi:hypothetical protein
MEPMNSFQGMNSASLCSLVSRYENPIPPRFQVPIDCLKIPALGEGAKMRYSLGNSSVFSRKETSTVQYEDSQRDSFIHSLEREKDRGDKVEDIAPYFHWKTRSTA